MVTITLLQPPFSATRLEGFRQITASVFAEDASPDWLSSLAWRLENMPDVTIFHAEEDGKPVGFKAGYASAHTRYYSWLGGIVPGFRRRGLARALMEAQHAWLLASRFNQVECHVDQDNTAMIELNVKSGMTVAGSFLKDGHPTIILQKDVSAS